MESADENIDDLRHKLEKANAELARLSSYVADIVNDNEKSTQLSDNKIERLQTNVKILEGQLEVAVAEKFSCAKKLSEVEVHRASFQRELDKLKLRNEKQEAKLKILRQELESMNERKKAISTKFKLMKSQENVHDIVMGALKSQFEEKIWDFLNEGASRIDYLSFGPSKAGESTKNMPASTSDNRISGPRNSATNLEIDVQPNGAEPISVENISDSNRCHTMKTVRDQTQIVSFKRKTSGTTIKRSQLTSTSTTMHTTAAKSVKLMEVSRSTAITERLQRPRRFLKCTFCWKSYESKPTQAFCNCQYKDNL